MRSAFNYDTAFSRNLGLVSEEEQARLRNTRIALAGCGGAGSAHAHALARLGIGRFHVADPDTFSLSNVHRQLGARSSTLGRGKATAMEEAILEINPEATAKVYAEGIHEENIDDFLDGVDVAMDGIEFFQMEPRLLLHRRCRELGIPVVMAGPIGYGAAVLVFLPDGPTFEDHFRITSEMTRAEQLIAFGLGLSPGFGGDIDPSRVDIGNESGPALISGCLMCAALAGTEVLKLVCKRGKTLAAPHGLYVDPYRGRTCRLPKRPNLRTLRGQVFRWFAFRKYPAFREMHERELDRDPSQVGIPDRKCTRTASWSERGNSKPLPN